VQKFKHSECLCPICANSQQLSLQKLHSEEKRRNEALSSVQEMCAQLETCKGDLIKAEKHRGDARALAVVYKTKVDALKKQLSEEEEKVQDLQWDREDLQRDREDLQRDREDLQRDCEDLQRDCEDLQRDCKDLQRDREDLQRDREDVQRDRNDLQRDRDLQPDRQWDSDLQRVCDLQPDRNNLQQRERYYLHRDRDNLQQEHSNLQRDYGNSQQECSNLGTPHAKSCSCGE
jgi:chromosome segregation ATPase